MTPVAVSAEVVIAARAGMSRVGLPVSNACAPSSRHPRRAQMRNFGACARREWTDGRFLPSRPPDRITPSVLTSVDNGGLCGQDLVEPEPEAPEGDYCSFGDFSAVIPERRSTGTAIRSDSSV